MEAALSVVQPICWEPVADICSCVSKRLQLTAACLSRVEWMYLLCSIAIPKGPELRGHGYQLSAASVDMLSGPPADQGQMANLAVAKAWLVGTLSK